MSKLDNLEAYMRRVSEGDDYLIPVDLIDDFDDLQFKIDDLDPETDEWYSVVNEFVDKFGVYVVEGNQFDIVYYINPEDLT